MAMNPILPDVAALKRTLSTPRARRLVILSILLLVSLSLTVMGIARTNLDGLGVDDFIEYWSAGRLNLTGGNPYSMGQMMVLEQANGWREELPVMMWNPPLTLTLAMPFSLFPYFPARLLWLLISAVLVVFAGDRLWLLYGGKAEDRGLALLFAMFFVPSLSVLQMGQIGVWLMIGLVGFLLFAKKERWLGAGALFALTAIKPHVAYLVWVALALWWINQAWWLGKPRWRLAIGGIAVVVIAWAIPMLINPQVTAQYLEATLNAPPLYWRTMTWGTILRLTFGVEREWLQLIAPTLGLGWFIYWWLKRRHTWNWTTEMPRLLLVSASTMAFGWFFDLVVLLPVVLQMGVWLRDEPNRALRRTVLVVYVLLQLLALVVNFAQLDAVYYIWFAPSLLLLYFYYTSRRTQSEAVRHA